MLTTPNTALLLVDYQGKLTQIVHDNEALRANIIRLIQGIQLLDVPIIWLEQNPKGLGPTAEEVQNLLHDDSQPIEKMHFNGYRHPEFTSVVDSLGRDNFLVAGLEAHVCVYQTVRGLREAGKHVEYVQDAISSRTWENKQIAMEKMKLYGAVPTSVEMALFELMETAEHPAFKEISALIK